MILVNHEILYQNNKYIAMKHFFKISIIALVLMCTVAQVSDAKTRRRHSNNSSSSGIPYYEAIGKPEKMKALGIEVIYENLHTSQYDTDNQWGVVAYGKDAKAVSKGNGYIDYIATGQHAFVYEWSAGDGYMSEEAYYFKNKADRDRFYKKIAKRFENLYTGYSNGWYYIQRE